jgi:hypothetical protein
MMCQQMLPTSQKPEEDVVHEVHEAQVEHGVNDQQAADDGDHGARGHRPGVAHKCC